ncbi:fumarylacetoacetate hydrolase family protein [Actinomadura syzygii]|uniref:fumarylacetoacetate hydrolase family protein n=1 Tax=Actinomadura syzygii TaxID=1427538 RepID=UPI0024827C16|nr:fumarylacetoacetate hydrolase family protein [Actinomadura syzygii]
MIRRAVLLTSLARGPERRQRPRQGESLGPAVVTADEVGDFGALRLTTAVNGETVQDAPLSDLAVEVPHLIERFSWHFAFRPGDVISTGTPARVAAGRRPPVHLRRGDVVTVAVAEIGELTNTVAGHHSDERRIRVEERRDAD